jgi:hypothetical protein
LIPWQGLAGWPFICIYSGHEFEGVPNRYAEQGKGNVYSRRGAAVIGWEDRDEAGRVALLHHIQTGQVKLGLAWTELMVGVLALASVAYHWPPLLRTVFQWF